MHLSLKNISEFSYKFDCEKASLLGLSFLSEQGNIFFATKPPKPKNENQEQKEEVSKTEKIIYERGFDIYPENTKRGDIVPVTVDFGTRIRLKNKNIEYVIKIYGLSVKSYGRGSYTINIDYSLSYYEVSSV